MQRDPYLDALRAGALLVVVLGHWVATLPRVENGTLVDTEHILDVWAPAGFFTWLVQVVPLFIFVSAAVSSEGVRQRLRSGQAHAHWWAGRALGLARPTVTYMAVLVTIVGIAAFTGGEILGPLNNSLTVHLWFLLTLLGVQALLPLSIRADERWGLKAVVGLILMVAAVDLIRALPAAPRELAGLGGLVTDKHDLFAWINGVAVWLVPQQLGIAWWNGRFKGRAAGFTLLLLGVVWLGLSVASGYPVSMVNGNLGGDTNLLPPTLAFLGVMWLQIGAALVFEDPIRGFLKRRRLGRWMAVFGALGLQLYLWHKFAELPATWLGVRLGLPIDTGMPGEEGFWVGRLGWIALCTLIVAPLMLAVLAIERRRVRDIPQATSPTAIIAGGAALLIGLAASLGLGAYPGALIGLLGVAAASYMLRAHPKA
nr:acyltransferase [Methylonatrum kenyense]